MLKFYSLSSTYLESGWAIHPLSGSLLKYSESKVSSFRSNNIPDKVSSALAFCLDPYTLDPTPKTAVTVNLKADESLRNVYKRLTFLRQKNFYISALYAGISRPLYYTSFEAMNAISRIFPDDRDSESCLQRALTVAKISKEFKSHGVLFIGAHLPLKNMHAWIIENGIQPDKEDRQWINYLPLMALAY